ncbi:sensor domain-containing diguanylate cyclase [Ancylobacter oerskovii]|uniref:diguanylate cyclase n=1 Tax=Ancylobacter oerskovii TaxID=459519 RepID=A0ABW4YWS8_9HYPH|nr:sensor domain-containing diguanylate cyclase [Ancylobacter oerskovii]MBS7542413.1 GGDEF domain-containing protein [Ancylobacter oerskovii]
MFRWVDDSAEPLLVIDLQALDVVALAPKARRALDLPPDAALPLPLAGVLAPDARLAELLQSPPAAAQKLPLRPLHADRPVEGAVRRLTDRHVLVSLNATPEGTLQDRMTDILNELPVAIEIYDENLNAIFYNRMSDDLFLYEEKVVLHHDEWWELGFPDPAQRAAAFAEWQQKFARLRDEPDSIQFSEWSVRCRDGSTRIVQFRYRRVGGVYVLALWDVTSERETAEQLRMLAGSDPLTGLWNRRRLLDAGAAAMDDSAGDGAPCSLLLIDIDHFKQINDRHGHGAGDAVLQGVAQRSLAQLRAADLMARIGGEEFAVLLPATSTDEAGQVAARLQEAIRQPVVLEGGLRLHVTVSIGLVNAAGETDFPALMERCDRALYRAKQDGRDRIVTDAP